MLEQTETPGKAGKVSKGSARDGAPDVAAALAKGAMELFVAQSYSTVSIQAIARYTKVNSALIYYYFGSKEELFLHVVESSVEKALRKFDEIRADATSPEEVISRWIELHVVNYVQFQQLARICLDYATTSKRTDRVDLAIGEFYRAEAVIVETAIESGIELGIFIQTDAKQLGIFISTYLDGALFRGLMFPHFDHQDAIRSMRKVVLSFLRTSNI
ncbi:TetR/AcrR family transcriptional regulator [soil metagenome]